MTDPTPAEMLSVHDHGNCELCDEIERALAAAIADADQAHEDARMMQERLTRVVEGSAGTTRRLEAVEKAAQQLLDAMNTHMADTPAPPIVALAFIGVRAALAAQEEP